MRPFLHIGIIPIFHKHGRETVDTPGMADTLGSGLMTADLESSTTCSEQLSCEFHHESLQYISLESQKRDVTPLAFSSLPLLVSRCLNRNP